MVETTAIVHIKPDVDEAVIALYMEACSLQQYAEGRAITSVEDVKKATDDLSLISKLKKAIEEKRKEYVVPINEHLKAVNASFKNFTEPLNQADSITRQKILDYRKEQERIRQEQERINQMRMEAAEKEMELKGELTEPVGVEEVAPEQPRRYRTGMGMLGTAKVRKWEVEDKARIPLEYLMVDAVQVGKLVRAGIPSIPGIRIWEEESTRVTSRKE